MLLFIYDIVWLPVFFLYFYYIQLKVVMKRKCICLSLIFLHSWNHWDVESEVWRRNIASAFYKNVSKSLFFLFLFTFWNNVRHPLAALAKKKKQKKRHDNYVRGFDIYSTLIFKTINWEEWNHAAIQWRSYINCTPKHHVIAVHFRFHKDPSIVSFGSPRNYAACPVAACIHCGIRLWNLNMWL